MGFESAHWHRYAGHNEYKIYVTSRIAVPFTPFYAEEGAMLKIIVLMVLTAIGQVTPAFAQECLHGPNETAGERDRREYAIRVARQINALQSEWIAARPRSGQYARPSQLKLPEMPEGFGLMFHLEGRRYTFSLKDDRDPCYFAIFSDHDGLIYATMPRTEQVQERPR
jgi:hypothetical protein